MRVVIVAIACSLTACGSPPQRGGDDAASSEDAAVADASPDAVPPDARPDAYDGPPLPDLTLDSQRALIDLAIETRTFAEDACELTPAEDCIGAPGERTLLRFAVESPNVGTDDLVLGTPSPDNEHFEYSDCHEHFHFRGYAAYSLVDGADEPAAVGHKQAFCLLDSERYVTDDPTVGEEQKYFCGYQGIQRGWSDVYHSRLPCQFVDITDTPPGEYTLEIELNAEQTLDEISYANNSLAISVDLTDPALSTPTEDCPTGFDPRVTNGLHRECGWDFAGSFACTPGQTVRVGCAEGCGLGACTGDAMLRVCDPARPDGNCSGPGALEWGDDACDSPCPRVGGVECPAGGAVDVYTAPYRLGEAYTCDIELEAAP